MTGTTDPSLLKKTVSGAGWMVGFRVVTRLLGIVSTLILARLLGPGDFGLVALASGFTQTVDAITNLSVHEAVVKERNPQRSLYDTAFTLSLIRGLLTTGVIAALAWPAAGFFHEPRLAAVLFALAVTNLVGAVENVATADFMRTFAFRKEFQLWTIPRIIQVACTITFALIWHTYWALVFGMIVGRVLRTALSYIMRPYSPRLSLAAWRLITGFTSWTWATSMVAILRDRLDTILIGRLFSPARVGIYALGNEIATLPTAELVDPLCRACFPSFAQLRHEGLSVAEILLRLLGAAALIVFPAGLGIAAVADPLVRLAFGPSWAEAIPMIQILGISATIGIVGSLVGTLFSANAMLRTSFTITVASAMLRAGLMLLLLPGGTLVTAAMIVAGVVALEQSAYLVLAMRRFAIPIAGVIRAVYRSIFAAAGMAAILAWSGLGFTHIEQAPAANLALAAAAGIALYAALLATLWLAAGRPNGPERDLLTVLLRIGAVVRRRATRVTT